MSTQFTQAQLELLLSLVLNRLSYGRQPGKEAAYDHYCQIRDILYAAVNRDDVPKK